MKKHLLARFLGIVPAAFAMEDPRKYARPSVAPAYGTSESEDITWLPGPSRYRPDRAIYYSPLHISLFSFKGWQKVRTLPEAVVQTKDSVRFSGTFPRGELNLAAPLRVTQDFILSSTTGGGLNTSKFFELVKSNPPSQAAPWYLVITMKEPESETFTAERFGMLYSLFEKEPFQKIMRLPINRT